MIVLAKKYQMNEVDLHNSNVVKDYYKKITYWLNGKDLNRNVADHIIYLKETAWFQYS